MINIQNKKVPESLVALKELSPGNWFKGPHDNDICQVIGYNINGDINVIIFSNDTTSVTTELFAFCMMVIKLDKVDIQISYNH